MYGKGTSAAGKSLLEMIWDELDVVYGRIKADGEDRELIDVGQAQGLAYAIALIRDPYQPNVPAVKRVAAKRWKRANE